jgi:hypothetical protein
MKSLTRAFNNLYFLCFLNGILLTSLFFLKIQSRFEATLFEAISRNVRSSLKSGDTDDSIVVKSLHLCYRLMHNRASVFGNDNADNDLIDILHPVTVDLITTKGACGSYSVVLASLLSNEGYAVRIAQMKANGLFAAHNVVEVNTSKRWEVLDPTYDLFFIRQDKKIASFEDVKHNWRYYIPQLPKEYNHSYRYEDVRYTNWEKIPVILPAIKKIITFFIGADRANGISLRTYFLRRYTVCFYIVLVFFLLQFIHTCKRIVATSGLAHLPFRIFPGWLTADM